MGLFGKIIWLILLLGYCCPVYANCWQIEDNDKQKLCLALVQNDSSYCWQIKSNDNQKFCLASIQNRR